MQVKKEKKNPPIEETAASKVSAFKKKKLKLFGFYDFEFYCFTALLIVVSLGQSFSLINPLSTTRLSTKSEKDTSGD